MRCTKKSQFDSANLDPEDFEWAFALEVGGENQELNLDNDCDGLSHSVISLPARPAWETNNPLVVVIDTPNLLTF